MDTARYPGVWPHIGLMCRLSFWTLRRWCYVYRAVDKQGRTVDFHLSDTRGIEAAKTFFRKALASDPDRPPRKITLDGHVPSHRAVRLLRLEQPVWCLAELRCCRYLNNIVQQAPRGPFS